MKENTYYLFDGNRKICYSCRFEKVLNRTTKTTDGKIFFNGCLVWAQNPDKYI